ncbi:hypothetical protein NLX83_33545 [Allokutzneria sp. A3M-2-11 16]|uniref:hypothetical protein n=1 Tax=Allokutzneria sp. A3M-2-11 16 TaxID=2962043 RepID=UPI0020B7335E|nr:hypothetical protein [Allokutzneria sp. A3M-2-11 16]MCP3804209.1 hypothetical protein [Allokutzneria sp. A3M-2-11 16]
MLELTLPPLLVMTTLAVLHRFHVLNRLSFIGLNRAHPLRDLVTAWRTHRTAEAVRASRTQPPAEPRSPYHGRHRHRGPVVIARGLEPPTVPIPALGNAQSRSRSRNPFRRGTKSLRLPRTSHTTEDVGRNPVRPAGRHRTAA